jgi:TP901 family phage tail tape measure protein
MASSFTVNADFKLDPSSINASARQVKLALGRITGQASEFQKSLDASTARVFAFGATTTVLAGISTAFNTLLRSTIEVEKRLVEINAIFQQSESVMNSFRESIFSVAQVTGQTFQTVADAAGELARQGLSAEETASRLEAALILTRISGLGAEDSVKALTAAINGFTSAALEAEDVTNKIVAVDTAFAVSAQDLAQGLARAGSTAEDAGVSFDQLLGLITAVEQRTARGGAVIGNAFKSIFTRLSRGTTISELQALGVEIDSTQNGIQKLQALSKALENIADPTVASKIKELAGGVFQINVVSATLKDLANDTSVFAEASKAAANASNDAFSRNAALNKSLSAQINSLAVGLTNLAEKIGGVTFGPLLTNLVGVANKVTEVFNNLLGEEEGNGVAKAFLKGIGTFISGPGLVLVTSAFLKIVRLVSKFALDGFKSVLAIGQASEKIKQVQGGIVGLLAQDEQLRKAIASSTLTQAQKEEAVLKAIAKENALLAQQEQILRRITDLAIQKGITGFSPSKGFSTTSRRSGGYIPNFSKDDFRLEEAEARALGASPLVKAKMGRGTIGGKKFIMNNQETEITNFGKNGDSAVIPKYLKTKLPSSLRNGKSASGFIPNFAVKDDLKFNENRDYGKKYVTESFVRKNLNTPSNLFTPDQEGRFKSTYPFKGKKIKDTYEKLVGGAGPVLRGAYDQWEQKQNDPAVNLTKLAGKNPAVLVPQGSESDIKYIYKGSKDLKPVQFDFPVKGINPSLRPKLETSFEKNFNAEKLEEQALKTALDQANEITKVVGNPAVKRSDIQSTNSVKGFTGAVRSAAGAIFDAAVSTAFGLKASEEGEKGGDFDVRGGSLGELFGKNPLPNTGTFRGLGDFKYSSGAQESMRKKTLKELRAKDPDKYTDLKLERAPTPKLTDNIKETLPIKKKIKRKAEGFVPKYAGGYIPNFAKGAYDSDFLQGSDKSLVLNKILQSPKKKDVLIAPAGAGKTTSVKKRGASIIKSAKEVDKFSQYLILSASGRAKKSTISAPLQKILGGVKRTGGSIEYLYVPNAEIEKRRNKRINKGSVDPRSRRALIGTKKAPKNQFDFVSEIKRLGGRVVRAASGHIPNEALNSDALSKAVQREKKAGLPPSKIRINQSNRLKNTNNPAGLAVTNTRDEPRGLTDVFASGFVKNFAKGFIPNFAGGLGPNPIASKQTEINTDGLQTNIDNTSEKTEKTGSEMEKAGKSIQRAGIAFVAIQAVTQVTSAVLNSAAEAKQKAIDKVVKASEKEIEGINKGKSSSEQRLAAAQEELAAIKSGAKAQDASTAEKFKLIDAQANLIKIAQSEIKAAELQVKNAEERSAATQKTIKSEKSLGERFAKAADAVTNIGLTAFQLAPLMSGFGSTLKSAGSKISAIADKFKGFGDSVGGGSGGSGGSGGGGGGTDVIATGGGRKKPKKGGTPKINKGAGKNLGRNAGSSFVKKVGSSKLGTKLGSVFSKVAGSRLGVLAKIAGKGLASGAKGIGGSLAKGVASIATLFPAAAIGLAIGAALVAAWLGAQKFLNDRKEKKQLQDVEKLRVEVNNRIAEKDKKKITQLVEKAKSDIQKLEGKQASGETLTKEEDQQLRASKRAVGGEKEARAAVENARVNAGRFVDDGQGGAKLADSSVESSKVRRQALQRLGEEALEQVKLEDELTEERKKQIGIEGQISQQRKIIQDAISKSAVLEQQAAAARGTAVKKINDFVKLVPKEFQGAAQAKAQRTTSILGTRQAIDNVSGARVKAKSAKEAFEQDPANKEKAEASTQAALDLDSANEALKSQVQSATVGLISSLQDTAEKIKSLGGESFKKAFGSVEEATNKFLSKPSQETGAALKEAYNSFERIEIPKEIKLRREENAVSQVTGTLGNVSDIQSGVPDILAATSGLKEIQSTNLSKEEKVEKFAEIEPILKAIEQKLGPETFKAVLSQGGFKGEEGIKKFQGIQRETEKNALSGQLKEGGLNTREIDEILKGYASKLDEDLESLKVFKNPEDIQKEFDNLKNNAGIFASTLLDYSNKFPEAKELAAAIGDINTKAKGAAASFEVIAKIGEAIGGFASEAETTVKGAKETIDKLAQVNTQGNESIVQLEASVATVIKQQQQIQRDLEKLQTD